MPVTVGVQATAADPNQQPIHSNATITVSGSQTLTSLLGSKEASLIVNVKASPTGVSPLLTFTLSELDPGDGVTVVGATVSGVGINLISTQVLTLPSTVTGIIKVSWTVGGSISPTFTQVYTTLVSKSTPQVYASTGTRTSVNASNGDTLILAANRARLGAIITNQSQYELHLILNPDAANAGAFTIRMFPYNFYEVPYGYTGIIRGMWTSTGNQILNFPTANTPTGVAAIMEFT